MRAPGGAGRRRRRATSTETAVLEPGNPPPGGVRSRRSNRIRRPRRRGRGRCSAGRSFPQLPSSSSGRESLVGHGARAHRTILRFQSPSSAGYARFEEPMLTSPARKFHGRDAELALIRGELERLSDGAETVVLVEGAAGMGKSRLLAEASTIARDLGIRVGSSAAEPGETIVELATLLAALFDGAEPLLGPGELATLHAQPEQRFWLLRDLQQLLERAALES